MELPGPDGFLLAADDPLRPAHLRLSEYLLTEEERGSGAFDVAKWRKLPKRELPAQVQAVLQRLKWSDEHDAKLQNAHKARIRLRTLLQVLHGIKAPYSEAELCALLDSTRALLGRIPPYGPVDRVL